MAEPFVRDQSAALSRGELRRNGAQLIEPGVTRERVIEIAGIPDEESDRRMIWKVGLSGADQLYFVVELDDDQRATRAYRPVP